MAAFTIGNQLGLSFVDKPVLVGTLARAVSPAAPTPHAHTTHMETHKCTQTRLRA